MSRFTAQDIASYAAVIVAVVALYVGWDQARIGRNQQHADVFPVIELKSQYVVKDMGNGTNARHLSLRVHNAGVGPAFIEKANWYVSDTQLDNASGMAKIIPTDLVSLDEYQGQPANFILGPNKSEVIWEIAWPNTNESRPKIEAFLRDFWAMKLDLCYCSLYQRCWVSSYQSDNPRPKSVKSCQHVFEVN